MKKQFLGSFPVLLVVACNLFSAPVFACPLGNNEMELSFARIMQNFGRLLIRPDSVVRKSQGGVVTDGEIQEGLEAIKATISCADAALDDREGKLLPSAGTGLTGDARKVFQMKYNKHMGEFKAILVKYSELFEKNLKAGAGNHDFSTGVVIDRQIREKANQSHEAI